MKTRQIEVIDPYHNPIWIKYECDHGARWTAVKGGAYEHQRGKQCNFSGCESGHEVTIKGETKDRHEAHEWFSRPEGRE